jgi:hypothetical protein
VPDVFVGAPRNGQWPLGVDVVENLLRQRFPDALIRRRTSAATGKDRVTFDLPRPAGPPRHGMYIDHDNLALSDADPQEWAETIAWFLTLLPPGTATVVMIDEGPRLVPLPDGVREPDAVAAFLAAIEQ